MQQYEKSQLSNKSHEGRASKQLKSADKYSTNKRKATNPNEAEVTPEKQPKLHNQSHSKSATHHQSKETKHHSKEAAFKEHENQEIDLTKDHLRIFLSNLDYK